MPYVQNALYGQGVPTYAETLSPLADVFKAFAPNPVRDLQIQGYVSKNKLQDIKGSQINQQMQGMSDAANAFRANDMQEVYASTLGGGDPQTMTALPKFVTGGYAARAIDDPNSVNQGTLASLVVGDGGNYKDTQPGFTADQSRQLQQNENTVAASRYGHELSAGASRYGHELDLQGTQYTANTSKAAKEFDTLHDTRKSTASGGAAAKVDPVKLDNALLQNVPGSFKDEKGRWQVDPSVSPADLAEVRARTAAYVQDNPLDQYGAIQRAIADVYGENPEVAPEVAAVDNPWYGSAADVPFQPAQVKSLAADQRPPRPGLAQQFAAPPPASAPAVPSMPTAQAGGAAPNAQPVDRNLVNAAKAASVPGANRDGIIKKLLANGYTAQQLSAAGL